MENNNQELDSFGKNKYSGLFGRFLGDTTNKIDSMVRHLDTQVNILISLNSAVLLFSVTQLGKGMNYFFVILILFSALAVICGLFAVHPPRSMRKRGQRESLMYNKTISKYATFKEYLESLKGVISDPDLILEQYAIETYNMASFYYLPKRKLFKLSRNFFLAGIVLASLFYFLNYLRVI